MPSEPPLASTSSPFLPRHHRAYMRPTPTGGEDQYHIDFINPLFQTASHIVQTRLPASGLIQPTYKEKLLLYSFFKQAVSGDVQQISARPGVFDMLGRAKWDAWKKLEGLQPVDAKKLYVDTLLKLLKKHAETPEARTLIEGLEGFTPSVARSDLTSTPSGSSSTPVRPTQHEDEPETEEEDLVTSDSEKDSSFQDNDEAPSSLGPYVTRAQLPDPVNMSQADPVVAETNPSKAKPLSNSRIIPHHQLRMSDRPASRAPTELSVGSRDRAFPDDTRSPANTRRLSAIQLAALISRPHRFDELDSLRSRGRPISRPASAVTNDVMFSALDAITERDRSEHITVAADACSSAPSSVLAPLPTSEIHHRRNSSRSLSRSRRGDLVQKIDHLQRLVSELQARLDKLETPEILPPPDPAAIPFSWRALLLSRSPHSRSILVRQWLKNAKRPFLSTLSHLFFICALMWISRVIGFYGWKAFKVVWKPRSRRRLE